MAIEGSLVDMGLLDVIQLTCRNMEEATVSLTNGERSGTIYVSGGQIVHASYRDTTGEDALYQLLRWHQGDFCIEKGVTTSQHTIDAPWTAVLIESFQRLDEEESMATAHDAEGFDEPLAVLTDSLDGYLAGEVLDAEGFGELLAELADSVDGYLAAEVLDADGVSIANRFEASHLSDAIFHPIVHAVELVGQALATLGAGDILEMIWLTTEYRFVVRPMGPGQPSIHILLTADGNLGAARMYLAAYLAMREHSLPQGSEPVSQWAGGG